MPHPTASARATVLEPKHSAEATPIRNPVTHIHIVGGLIAGVILFIIAAIAFAVT